MTYGYDGVLKVESDGGVRIVTLNDPEKLNAMTDPLHEALTDVWVHIMRDNDARAVVLTGAGRAVSARRQRPRVPAQRRGRRVPAGGHAQRAAAGRPHSRLPPAGDLRRQRARGRPRVQPRGI